MSFGTFTSPYTKGQTSSSGNTSPLTAIDIPNLDTSKITSGTLSVARGGLGLNSISANKLLFSTANNVFGTSDITPFGLSLLDDINAASARTTLGISTNSSTSGHNYMINGGFFSTLAGSSFTTVGRVLEMWNSATFGTGGVVTVSQQSFTPGQTDVPRNPKFFLRWNQTTGGTGTNPEFQGSIENAETLAGEDITVSFWAKSSVPITVNFALRQNFGTGGTPSAAVDTSIQACSITTTWQRFTYTISMPSVAGKTFGTSENTSHIRLRWLFPLSTVFSFDLADVKFESGQNATLFERLYDYDSYRISKYIQVVRCTARFIATAASQEIEVPVPYQRIMRNAPTGTIVTGGFRLNLNVSFPILASLSAFGGRFQIRAAAAGDCYAINETITLDARL